MPPPEWDLEHRVVTDAGGGSCGRGNLRAWSRWTCKDERLREEDWHELDVCSDAVAKEEGRQWRKDRRRIEGADETGGDENGAAGGLVFLGMRRHV